MNYRKIILITLVVLVLVALMYKMSDMYTAPPNVEGIVRQLSSNLALSNVQTQFVAYLFTTGMEPSSLELKEIGKTFTNEQRERIKFEISKYAPPQTVGTVGTVGNTKTTRNTPGFSCVKTPNNTYSCTFF